ncbi:ANO8 protein, partial [Ptilonorhynchus violaceus]|nr:ANO8 protein [Ptilonorhynchus violaceus]
NLREVSQPHLYRRLRRGDLDARGLGRLCRSLLALLAPRRPPARSGEKCPNGGCGVPEEEEDEEEEEAAECGPRLKKVSFAQRAERRPEPGGRGGEDEPFPTLAEKGADPGAFELGEDEEEEEEEEEEAPGSPARRRKEEEGEEGEEEEGRKRGRASWIDPPEEDYPTQLTQAEVESCMRKYEDTFQDYQEMFIQFGYVVLFSAAFPLAAACALLNNVLEIRSDAFKLCSGLQRPFGQRVHDIGQWQKVMEAMGVVAIVVNCYLIAQCGQLQRLFPWLSPEGAIVSVVVLEVREGIGHGWDRDGISRDGEGAAPDADKHERQAQHHFQQQQRRRREEEERQRHAEFQARKERESNRDEAKGEGGSGQDPTGHEKIQGKGKSSGSGGSSDKPKRPSSLLATNNVLKLKQIIPLQGKFLSGSAGGGGGTTARSPQSPTGSGENKLPGFLSFKFLKSPEAKRDVASGEKAQSPTKPFNPGKLFNFGKSDGNGATGA